jgi:hypothetical protein
LTGWRGDPTARYEGRYYLADHPTNRVRNGRFESTDPDGGKMLPDYIEAPTPRSTVRSTWLTTGACTAVIVVAAAVTWALLQADRRPPPSPDTEYLAALNEAGLTNQFNSDANALAHGRQVCRRLEDGEPQQGLPADKIAVDAFCPKFTQGFRILEIATIPGVFILTDSEDAYGIASDGELCEGADGYSDVGHGTAVNVKNGKGEILATTSLGQGKGNTTECRFDFSFPLTEGEELYVVSVGRRGEFNYPFELLRDRGVQIHLGH